MNESNEKQAKILVIVSTFNSKKVHKYKNSIISKVDFIRKCGVNCDLLIDPSQYVIESHIYENSYLCVLPCTMYSYEYGKDGKVIDKGFNIIQLLEYLKQDYIGSSFLSHCMVDDRVLRQKNFRMHLPSKVVTKALFHNNEKFMDSICHLEFPLILKIANPKNTPNIHDKRVVYSKDELMAPVCRLFGEHTELNEIMIEKYIEDVKEFRVTIIGNQPRTNISVAEIYHNQESQVYKNFDGTPELKEQLISLSHHLFNIYRLTDFASFKYLFDVQKKKTYLLEADILNYLNDDFFSEWEGIHNYHTDSLIIIILIVYLTRRKTVDKSSELISKFIDFIPGNIVKELLPPELPSGTEHYNDYKEVCNILKKGFLQPNEENRYVVVDLIKDALDCLPIIEDPESPFLGEKENDYKFLEKFEKIPDGLNDSRSVLKSSTKILQGLTRWHSPATLHNVNPPVLIDTVAASAIINLYNPCAMMEFTSAGILKMERQIVRQLSRLVGWDENKSAGAFTFGGKACIIYALKIGINRCLSSSMCVNTTSPLVITSECGHFSIKMACTLLGINTDSYIKIKSNESGNFNFLAFEEVLLKAIKNRQPIACIIFSGGNTTHSSADDLKTGKAIIEKLFGRYKLDYRPFIYFDTVIGWPWLFYKNYDFKKNTLGINDDTLSKIEIMYRRVSYSSLADGVGIDFHKGGFSPMNNSVFLAKEADELYMLFNKKVSAADRNPYLYTLRNSRSSAPIVSAWIVLQSAGLVGFQAYVANMVSVTVKFMKILPQYDFEIILEDSTFGFSTVFWASKNKVLERMTDLICASRGLIKENNEYLYMFSEYLMQRRPDDAHEFVIRFIPDYRRSKNGEDIAVLTVLPMTLNIDEDKAEEIAKKIGNIKKNFDKTLSTKPQKWTYRIPKEIPK